MNYSSLIHLTPQLPSVAVTQSSVMVNQDIEILIGSAKTTMAKVVKEAAVVKDTQILAFLWERSIF